ncbi:MAG: adenylyltransferase/cytidyltransferase family protein, partial [Bacteroidales bacterium]|nr:adenylyltransferase/cytidyltransferase family protein [Bacteroidales bacterium]
MIEGVELKELPLSLKSIRRQVETFLLQNDLLLDGDLDYYVGLFRDDEMLAGGGLAGDVIKCVAVSSSARSMNLSNTLVSHLRSVGNNKGYTNLYVFTKPNNRELFENLSFNIIAEAPKAILGESSFGNGIQQYCKQLQSMVGNGVQGCIVMNCNPVTKGHVYLIETAAKQVDTLHVFCVKEDASVF